MWVLGAEFWFLQEQYTFLTAEPSLFLIVFIRFKKTVTLYSLWRHQILPIPLIYPLPILIPPHLINTLLTECYICYNDWCCQIIITPNPVCTFIHRFTLDGLHSMVLNKSIITFVWSLWLILRTIFQALKSPLFFVYPSHLRCKPGIVAFFICIYSLSFLGCHILGIM